MLNYRLGTVNEKHWGIKPVFRCSRPHTKHFLEKKKNNKTNRKVNKYKMKNQERVKKRKSLVQKVFCL